MTDQKKYPSEMQYSNTEMAKVVVMAGKVKNKQEQYEKTIIELKGRVAKFHKPSITLWAKAVSQHKNKRKSAATTQSIDITN